MAKKIMVVLILGMLFGGIGIGKCLAEEIDTATLEQEYPLLSVFKGVEVHGYVDIGANYNFIQPDSQSNSTLRVFDRKANSATLHMVELSLERAIKEGGFAGFRLDLDFGKDANITAPADTDSSDEFDVEQAYVSLRAPVGKGIDFKVGKFVTLLGAEVIEAPENYNYSRSFLFGLAIPFTHTGVLGSYAFNDMFGLSAGVVNGCDVIEDNNNAQTLVGNISFAPADYFSLGVNGVWGAEQNNNDSSKRGVIDTVATFKPPIEALDKFTFVANFDYGEEEDAVTQGQTAKWKGIAGYIHYDVLDWLGLAVRLEEFDDDDGARTGTAQDLREITVTCDFKIYENVLTRLEYRHDDSDNRSAFSDSTGSTKDTQDTIGVEVAYVF